MRVETIGLRTWLLIAFAGWALLACMLALAGLGGRVALPPDDALAPPPLPALAAAAGERLGAADRYADIAARPVFAQDRLPHPFHLTGGNGEGAASTSLRLTGVLLTPQLRMATLTTEQGQSLRLRLQGEAVSGWRLLELAPRAATVEGPGGTRTLELQVFNGQGGPASAAPGQAAPAAAGNAPAAPAPAIAAAPAAAGTSAPPTAPPGSSKPESGAAPPPAPSEAQLQAIRERIEARRRQLRERQQNGSASGQ